MLGSRRLSRERAHQSHVKHAGASQRCASLDHANIIQYCSTMLVMMTPLSLSYLRLIHPEIGVHEDPLQFWLRKTRKQKLERFDDADSFTRTSRRRGNRGEGFFRVI